MSQSAPLPERLAKDLDGSFPDLVLAVQEGLYSGALRMTGSLTDAEDIAQETLVRAYRALGTYPPGRIRRLKLEAWIWTIAANLCRNRARRRSRKPESPLGGIEPPAGDAGPEDAAVGGDTRDRLAALVGELPWPMRAGVVMRHVVGLSYGEIADALERPVGTVKADVHRGLARLRNMIDREEL